MSTTAILWMALILGIVMGGFVWFLSLVIRNKEKL